MRRFLILLLVPSAAFGQPARIVTLRPPDAKIHEEFSAIASVRELSNGRVLVTDPSDKGLVVVDFARGTAEPIGRKGSGPGEYQRAAPLHALAGDSTLMVDQMARRWLLLSGSRIVTTIPSDAPAVQATQGLVTGADWLGHVLTRGGMNAFSGSREIGKGDSSLVIRVSRSTGARDTIALSRMAPAQMSATTDARGQLNTMSVRRTPFSVGEEPVLFPDGYLAVTRLDPFRVDWRAPNGSWSLGPDLGVPLVRVNEREKKAFMARTAKASGQPVKSPDTRTDWPESLPPYGQNPALFAAPDGRLLVLRFRSADFPETRYFVVNRRGALDAELELAENERIVGFGAKSAYVVVTDDDGIQRLRRHPWP